jgi:hypothetical protein
MTEAPSWGAGIAEKVGDAATRPTSGRTFDPRTPRFPVQRQPSAKPPRKITPVSIMSAVTTNRMKIMGYFLVTPVRLAVRYFRQWARVGRGSMSEGEATRRALQSSTLLRKIEHPGFTSALLFEEFECVGHAISTRSPHP